MVFEETDMALLLQAAQFAAEKHRAQRRKDQERTPYINHPISVTHSLWTIGGVRDVTTLTAALLHDTLEDTATTPDEIEHLFGKDVLALVQEVSDDKSLPKEVRKQLQIEHAPHKSSGAKEIKLADKTANVQDISHSPPSDWPQERLIAYLDWTEAVVAGLRGANAKLEDHYDTTLREARAILERAQ